MIFESTMIVALSVRLFVPSTYTDTDRLGGAHGGLDRNGSDSILFAATLVLRRIG